MIGNADGKGANSDSMEKMRIQNEEYFKVYDKIAKNMSKEEQIEILNANRQTIPDTEAQVNGPL